MKFDVSQIARPFLQNGRVTRMVEIETTVWSLSESGKRDVQVYYHPSEVSIEDAEGEAAWVLKQAREACKVFKESHLVDEWDV